VLRSETLTEPYAAKVAEAPSPTALVLAWLNHRLRGYFPALGAFLLAMVLHTLASLLVGRPLLGPFPFFLYLLAFLTAAWCGYGPGLLVTILITCGVPYLFKPGFSIQTVDVGGVGIFLLLSAIVSGVASSRRRTEALLRRLNKELDERVAEQTKLLRDQLAELGTLYAEISFGLCFLDADLRFVRVNEKLAAITGSPVEAHLGSEFRDVVGDAFANLVEPLYRRVLSAAEPILDYEITGPSSGTGARRVWSVSCSPVVTDGQVLGLQVVIQDITERTLAEQALNESNASLRRANADLEQFAFSASHDLQEPLRNVAIYSQMLKRKFGGLLGADGDQYIRYTVEGALRMQQLVNDLLAFTEASFSDAALAHLVSAKEALAQALSDLDAAIVESQAAITFSELPLVRMRKVHLVQLFQNLVGNSIKYRKQEPLRIHVSAVPHQAGSWLFAVKDNGIGIDPCYQQQVFGIFKRLHRHEEYPGTGIGLAICKRIVEQHRGKIWVESQLGEGATFLFTLPAESDTLKAT
jgi:PAS domain S-box-containing protein